MSDLILIDLSSILHPLFHLSSNDPNPDATSIKTIERVRALASGQPFVAVCIDSAKSIRKDADPTYKANRERNEPLAHQMRIAIETLRGDGFPVWGADGYEADDVIASAVVEALKRKVTGSVQPIADVDRIVVVTADKDLGQVVSDAAPAHVVIKSLKDGTMIDEAGVLAKFGVKPSQMCDFLTLCGDTSDNVIGCKGIGPKGAAGLLGEFGTIDNIYAAIDKGMTPTLTPNLRTRLQDFRAQWPKTRALIQLRFDVPIPFDEIFRPRTAASDVAVFDDEDGVSDTFDHDANTPTRVLPFSPAEAREQIDEVMPSRQTNGYFVNGTPCATISDAQAEVDRLAKLNPPILVDTTILPKGQPHAERSANAEDRAPGRAVVRDDALQGHEGHRPGDANRNGIPAPAEGIRDHRSDAGRVRQPEAARASVPARAEHAEPASGVLVPVVVDYERQLEPRSLGEAYKLAQSMFQARLFSAYGNPDAVLSTILAGREFGMAAMASLRAFHIVEGKPTLAADTIRALVLRSGAAEYFRCTERTAERATFVTKRRGEPEMSLTYTVAEGRAAFAGKDDAWAKSGWGKNPADMCVARAGAKLARLVYADVVHGLYAKEEFEQ